jgi:streptogramin lyase
VADRYSSRLTQLDATAGTVISSLPLHASSLAFAEGQLWLADDIGDRLIRLDPTSGSPLVEIPLGRTAGATDVAMAADHLWVAAPRAGGLLRVDPSAATTTDIQVGIADVRSVSASGGVLWLASPGQDRVARVDAASGRVAVSVEVCDTPVDIAATPSGAWVVCALDRQLWRLDLAGTVTLKITLAAVPSALAADGELVLVALRAD